MPSPIQSSSTDVLLLTERVQNTIALGESHFREFKSALDGKPGQKKPGSAAHLSKYIAEALVAFANADGGELLIGVENDGAITGVPHGPEDLEIMQRAPTTHVHADSRLPLTFCERLALGGQVVLFFAVSKGTEQIYQLADGRCVRRKDKETVPASFEKIQFERREVRSREYDRAFVDGVTVQDLDLPLIRALAEQYLSGLSVERYLQQMGLAEYDATVMRLRRAAVLLFAKNPDKCPQSRIRFLRVLGTELSSGAQYNVSRDETVPGNLFELVQKSWEHLRSFLVQRTEFGGDARFEQKYIYPESACREALVNAIAHRDYTSHNGTEIYVFDDRIEIKNPGALLSSLTVDDLERLEGDHESRNVLVARVLRENKFMRELGEGMKRIFGAMQEREFEKPRLYSNTHSFTVTFTHRSVFSQQQQHWLEQFGHIELTPLQRRIVVLGMAEKPISRKDIVKAMRTDDRDTYDREVSYLRKTGVLTEIRTNPNAAQLSRSQNIPKDQVPRFQIRLPETSSAAEPRKRSVQDLDPSRTVFVGRVLPSYTASLIQQEFEDRFGKVRVVFPKDRPVGQSLGYCFVELATAAAAQQALQPSFQLVIQGNALELRPYRRKPSR